MALRIAEISTLSRPVPPRGEGSVENLVSVLTEGLVDRGHDVTLFATADSRTRARLSSPVAESYTSDPEKWDWQLYEAFQVREACRRHGEFDIIHCHSYHHALTFCDFVPIPVLMSMHLEPGPDYLFLAERSQNYHLHFCSEFQARDFGAIPRKSIIHHGLPTGEALKASGEERGDDLVFLGRFHPEKGALEAIEIARRCKRRLLLAAPENDYYRSHIRPHVDGRHVVYVGELSGQAKFRFLARASALLYPLTRGEPFGLVLIEAMMCGTPVIAPPIGAVSEIIEHGVTGWMAESESDYEGGIEWLANADNDAIRHKAIERFSSERMIGELEALMTRLVEERGGHA